MYSDTTADMLTRIRNGYMARKLMVNVPFSNFKKSIAEVLEKTKYIDSYLVTENGGKKIIEIKLLYKNGKPVLEKIIKISKSGRKIYSNHKDLPYVLSGYGIAIITTSQGVMTAKEARKRSLGGEVICKIW